MLTLFNSNRIVDELKARILFLETRDVVLYHRITEINRNTLITLSDSIEKYEELTFESQIFESGVPTISDTRTFKVDLLTSGSYTLIGFNRSPTGVFGRIYVNPITVKGNRLELSRDDTTGSSEKVNLVRITGKKKKFNKVPFTYLR